MSTRTYAAKHRQLGLCRNCCSPLATASINYCDFHLEKERIRSREKDKRLSLQLKLECFRHYGNKCSCCGEKEISFLTIDHIHGFGNIHRIKLFKHNVGGVHMYRWLQRNNYPAGFQILCMNCNWATRYNRVCPHKLGGVA